MRHFAFRLIVGSFVGLSAFAQAGLFSTPFDLVEEVRAKLPAGKTLTGVLPFGNKQIPLPEGEWMIAASRAEVTSTSYDTGGLAYSTGAWGSLVLYRLDATSSQVQGRLMISGQLNPRQGNGWYDPPSYCGKIELGEYHYEQKIVSARNQAQDCGLLYLDVIGDGQGNVEMDKAEALFLREHKIPVPLLVVSRFRHLTHNTDALNLIYSASLETLPQRPTEVSSWGELSWKRSKLDVVQQSLITEVGSNADTWQTAVKQKLDF